VEYGTRKTEIPAASRGHCSYLSRASRRPDAGASWFSQNSQKQRNPQLEELARTLAQQVTLNLAPMMRSETPDEKRIGELLELLTRQSRVLDAGVYDDQGDLVARSGEGVKVRDRLALDGKKAGGYFNQQIVEPIQGKNGPLGYLRLTLDTHTLATEAQQVDNTTNILRLMLLLSLAIGVVLTRTLLQGKRTRWQQSPFLLTANKPVQDEDKDESE
jgi:membrane protein